MSNDDSKSQQFIREVDEELRRAQLKSVWDRFAPVIVGVCVLIVLATAGYRGWLWWQERVAAQNGDRFTEALAKLQGPDKAAGEAELQALAGSGETGYAILARFRLAGDKAAAGDKAGALKAYDEIAADGGVGTALQGLARVRAGLLALDTGDLPGARTRVTPLDQPGNGWRHAAREIIGTAAYASGEMQAARDAFGEIQQDAETPPDLWVRANMMVSLIDGQLAAPGSADASVEQPGGAAQPGGAVQTGAQPGAAAQPAAAAPAATPAQAPTPAAPAQPTELPVPAEPTAGALGDSAPLDTDETPVAPSDAAPDSGPDAGTDGGPGDTPAGLAAPPVDTPAPGTGETPAQPVIPPQ